MPPERRRNYGYIVILVFNLLTFFYVHSFFTLFPISLNDKNKPKRKKPTQCCYCCWCFFCCLCYTIQTVPFAFRIYKNGSAIAKVNENVKDCKKVLTKNRIKRALFSIDLITLVLYRWNPSLCVHYNSHSLFETLQRSLKYRKCTTKWNEEKGRRKKKNMNHNYLLSAKAIDVHQCLAKFFGFFHYFSFLFNFPLVKCKNHQIFNFYCIQLSLANEWIKWKWVFGWLRGRWFDDGKQNGIRTRRRSENAPFKFLFF